MKIILGPHAYRAMYVVAEERKGIFRAYDSRLFHENSRFQSKKVVFRTNSMKKAVETARRLTGAKRSQADFNGGLCSVCGIQQDWTHDFACTAFKRYH